MNFLLNMNIPRALGPLLEREGHRCRHVGDIGLGRAPDTEVVEAARRAEEVILTHDLDYGHLLAVSGEAKPSVVIFRLGNVSTESLFHRWLHVWGLVAQALSNGAIVVIQDDGVRIRPLPLERA